MAGNGGQPMSFDRITPDYVVGLASETIISAELRRLVVERAARVCEYCLLAEAHHPRSFQVNHVIGEKHGGAAVPENLALTCPECKTAKNTCLGTYDPLTDKLALFFDPRRDNWWEHFILVGARIEGLTASGRGTALFFHFNDPDRIEERKGLIADRLYPTAEALR